jgi:hypothetical protein
VSGDLLSQGLAFIEGVELGYVVTNIGVIQDAGHAEPWIIAMDVKPTRARVLDYGMRWGLSLCFQI